MFQIFYTEYIISDQVMALKTQILKKAASCVSIHRYIIFYILLSNGVSKMFYKL